MGTQCYLDQVLHSPSNKTTSDSHHKALQRATRRKHKGKQSLQALPWQQKHHRGGAVLSWCCTVPPVPQGARGHSQRCQRFWVHPSLVGLPEDGQEHSGFSHHASYGRLFCLEFTQIRGSPRDLPNPDNSLIFFFVPL